MGGTNVALMAHPRSACPTVKYHLGAVDLTTPESQTNQRRCAKCYCKVCGVPALEVRPCCCVSHCDCVALPWCRACAPLATLTSPAPPRAHACASAPSGRSLGCHIATSGHASRYGNGSGRCGARCRASRWRSPRVRSSVGCCCADLPLARGAYAVMNFVTTELMTIGMFAAIDAKLPSSTLDARDIADKKAGLVNQSPCMCNRCDMQRQSTYNGLPEHNQGTVHYPRRAHSARQLPHAGAARHDTVCCGVCVRRRRFCQMAALDAWGHVGNTEQPAGRNIQAARRSRAVDSPINARRHGWVDGGCVSGARGQTTDQRCTASVRCVATCVCGSGAAAACAVVSHVHLHPRCRSAGVSSTRGSCGAVPVQLCYA